MTNKTRQRDPWGLEIVHASRPRTRSPARLCVWGNRAAAVLATVERAVFSYAALSADPSARVIAQSSAGRRSNGRTRRFARNMECRWEPRSTLVARQT